MNLVLCFNGALQMYTYEGCRQLYDYLLGASAFGEKNFIAGGASKILTTFITYPFTTIRTRIQQNQYYHRKEAKYKNIRDVTLKIMKQEGVTGFYKGISPNLMRGIPQRSIYFYFY